MEKEKDKEVEHASGGSGGKGRKQKKKRASERCFETPIKHHKRKRDDDDHEGGNGDSGIANDKGLADITNQHAKKGQKSNTRKERSGGN